MLSRAGPRYLRGSNSAGLVAKTSRLAMTAAIREVFATKPAEFDPRKYLGPARDNMKKLYIHKIKEVLGSDGKAE